MPVIRAGFCHARWNSEMGKVAREQKSNKQKANSVLENGEIQIKMHKILDLEVIGQAAVTLEDSGPHWAAGLG